MQMAPADRAQQCAHLKALPKDMMSNSSACSEELRQTLTMAKQVCASDSGTAEDAYADIGARSRTLALPWGNDMWCQNVSTPESSSSAVHQWKERPEHAPSIMYLTTPLKKGRDNMDS